jgi:hypothetical protein
MTEQFDYRAWRARHFDDLQTTRNLVEGSAHPLSDTAPELLVLPVLGHAWRPGTRNGRPHAV